MLRLLSALTLLSALAAPMSAADSAPPAYTGVVRHEGRPVPGARVWLLGFGLGFDDVVDPVIASARADEQGRFSLPVTDQTIRPRGMLARDDRGRVACHLFEQGGGPGEESPVLLTLRPTGMTRGTVADAGGKPVAGARLQVVGLSTFLSNGVKVPVSLPADFGGDREAQTDARGAFELPGGLPEDVTFSVTAPGRDPLRVTAPQAEPCELRLDWSGSARVRITGVDDPKKIAELPLQLTQSRSRQANGKPDIQFTRDLRPGPTDMLVLSNLAPGSYRLSLKGYASTPLLPNRTCQFEVKPGATAEAELPLRPAAAVSGRLVDAETKAGLAGVKLRFYPAPNEWQDGDAVTEAVTDAEGRFRGYASPGNRVVHLAKPPRGYVTPSAGLTKPTRLTVDKPFEFPDIALTRARVVEGTAVDDAGKLVAGAEVRTEKAVWSFTLRRPVSDTKGRFTVPDVDPKETLRLWARTRDAVTDGQIALEPAKGPGRVVLSEKSAARLTGRVVDSAGKPVPDAQAAVTWWVQRENFGMGVRLETCLTDAEGRFRSKALWPNHRYQVAVRADGFGQAEIPAFAARAGETHDCGTITLRRAELVVEGRVVDSAGKPLAGVEVINHGDAEKRRTARTGADGAFRLRGLSEGDAYVCLRKDGYQFRVYRARAGAGKSDYTLLRADEPHPVRPVHPPDPGLAGRQKDLARRLAERGLALPAEVKSPYEGRLFTYLRQADAEAARRWLAAERKRGNPALEKDVNLSMQVRRAESEDLAADDPDGALAVLAEGTGQQPGSYLNLYFDLADALRDRDAARAARFAEEGLTRARALPMPERIWWLARCGKTMERLGKAGPAEKLARDAAALAEKIDGTHMQGYARGRAAAALARYDATTARKLLDPVKEPQDFNRYLAWVILRIADADPARASGWIKELKAPNGFISSQPESLRTRIAYRLAAARPEEAVRQAEAIDKPAHRVVALAGVAVRVAPKDAAFAHRLIDRALATIDDAGGADVQALGPAAAWVAVQARAAGYPDLAAATDCVLANRPTAADSYSAEGRDTTLAAMAAILALTDPATASALVPPGDDTAMARDNVVQRGALARLTARALLQPDAVFAEVTGRLASPGKAKIDLYNTGVFEALRAWHGRPEQRVSGLMIYFGTLSDSDDDE